MTTKKFSPKSKKLNLKKTVPGETMTDFFVCSADTSNGDVLKNFTKINGSKSRALLIFCDREIFMENATDDTQICCKGKLLGESINLKWNSQIPRESRVLPLIIEQSKIASTFGKIQTKDTVKIQVYKNARSANAEPGNDMEYTISLTRGTLNSSDGREGVQLIPALAHNYVPNVLNPPTDKSLSFAVPFRDFKRMITTFTKQKKGTLTIQFYSTTSPEFGKIGCGISICNSIPPDGRCDGFEKFGDIAQTDDNTISNTNLLTANSGLSFGSGGFLGAASPAPPGAQISSTGNTGLLGAQMNSQMSSPLNLAASTTTAATTNTVAHIEDKSTSGSSSSSSSSSKPQKKPTEFSFSADKIDLLQKFASIYKDGNVIINYEPEKHLCISGNIGGFGIVKLYFHNSFVSSNNSKSKLINN